jgi:hypothetical protein
MQAHGRPATAALDARGWPGLKRERERERESEKEREPDFKPLPHNLWKPASTDPTRPGPTDPARLYCWCSPAAAQPCCPLPHHECSRPGFEERSEAPGVQPGRVRESERRGAAEGESDAARQRGTSMAEGPAEGDQHGVVVDSGAACSVHRRYSALTVTP